MLTAPESEQVLKAAPATAVGVEFTIMFTVLLLEGDTAQADSESIDVMVKVVVPGFNAVVVKVAVPGLPAVKVTVAIVPVAMVAPVRL
jgi:hypothetical protein